MAARPTHNYACPVTFPFTPESEPDPGRQPIPRSVFRQAVDSLLAVVFPTSCLLCGGELAESSWSSVCRPCWDALVPWAGAVCARCGLPMASDRVSESSEEPGAAQPRTLCAQCRTAEYAFDLARSFGVYGGVLRAAVLELKFHRRVRLGRRLGEALWAVWVSIEEKVETRPGELPVLVPVPLHRLRERERGFNQAELLARGLARGLNRRGPGRASRAPRVEARCLSRARATLPQAGLSLPARQENVRGVFEVRQPERVRDRVVVLVDDVMTTCATASACGGALKRAGARQVVVLTLARATPEFPDAVFSSHQEPVDDPRRERQ
jgi:ComF family protein